MNNNKDFWNNKYLNNETGWDIGFPSTPIVEYFKQINNKDLKILIPGCGNGYEAEHLFNNGFKNVYVIDISENAIFNFKKRNPKFPSKNIICGDFFEHNSHYDLIIEQTFFCAITPSLRSKYVTQIFNLLNPQGRLVGLLFNIPLYTDNPPYGGNKEEYLSFFSPLFEIHKMDLAYNSIEPRKGNELFINLVKK